MGIHWSPEMDAALREEFAKGTQLSIIGDVIGVAPNTASKRARELALERPAKPQRPQKMPRPRDEREMRFADLLAGGASPQAAANRLGYANGNSVLQRIRSKLGWQAV